MTRKLNEEQAELLDRDSILAEIDERFGAPPLVLRIESEVDSTNDRLLAMPASQRHRMALLAEHQTAGRGRRGRQWVSPCGRNIYLSLGWTFETGASALGCLPLVVALAACDALAQAGLTDHRVKWPNDLMLDGRKLGGCLVDIQGDAKGPCHAVMGVGLNLYMPSGLPEAAAIDQPWTDLGAALPGLSRNRLAGLLLNAMLAKTSQFSSQGFQPLQAEWRARDGLAGQQVELSHASGTVRGRVLGISDRGALRLQLSSGTGEYTAGEVSIRNRDS
ncbi:MAG TPA: biotin--[acetyl-CoA-carboxylase] ligase [Xanthomonadales bacterium]|nr:biotin--[acetyl-CoA-carboxylase] ligase [Xanthomonadales bacterium]